MPAPIPASTPSKDEHEHDVEFVPLGLVERRIWDVVITEKSSPGSVLLTRRKPLQSLKVPRPNVNTLSLELQGLSLRVPHRQAYDSECVMEVLACRQVDIAIVSETSHFLYLDMDIQIDHCMAHPKYYSYSPSSRVTCQHSPSGMHKMGCRTLRTG